MNLSTLLAGVCLMVAGGSAALAFSRRPAWAGGLAAGAAVIGCGLGLVPCVGVLLGSPVEVLRLPWSVPIGRFTVGLDALSAFFFWPSCR